MKSIRDLILNNSRVLLIIVAFLVTMYVQHVSNTNKLIELNKRCHELEWKIQDQYEKIDAIKLDKSVFEVTISQFGTIHTDIREMRADIKELLKNVH